MKEDYFIIIEGKQLCDGQTENLKLSTIGEYYTKNGKRFIKYVEYDESDDKYSMLTIIEIDSTVVTLRKNIEDEDSLILEKGRRHTCYYYTPVGNVKIGVYTSELDMNLNDDGGTVFLKYSIEIGLEYFTDNELKITVSKK